MHHTSEIIIRYAFESDIPREKRDLLDSSIQESLNFHDGSGFMMSFGISYEDFPPFESVWVRIFLKDIDDNAQFIIDKTEEIIMELLGIKYYEDLKKDVEKLKS